MDWRPSASTSVLHARAKLNATIRDFFRERCVLEVETPLLCSSTATEPHLESWPVGINPTRYLQTSPEFAMKRLLAAGSGPIFQLCKAFRMEQPSPRHQPEFTMLEWYRPGWSLAQLLEEVAELVAQIRRQFQQPSPTMPETTYGALFQQHLGICPHLSSREQILHCAQQQLSGDFQDWDKSTLLDLLMSHLVEPKLTPTGHFVTEFPAAQAALASQSQTAQGVQVADRAELFIGGIEIANAYQELTDPAELRRRTVANLASRSAINAAQLPMPDALLAAMSSGLPVCAGVALGVDRLLMSLLAIERIDEVLTFPLDRA